MRAKSSAPAPLDRGRPIFFYVDDVHMDLSAINTARKLIAHFIENEMGQNDEVAIASASGQIGFLQQLTDNKAVLTAALERLKVRLQSVRDFEQPQMSEYHAVLITNYDSDITDYFTEGTMRLFPGITRETAEPMVMTRARVLMQQGGVVTTNSPSGTRRFDQVSSETSGRKLMFFLPGGSLWTLGIPTLSIDCSESPVRPRVVASLFIQWMLADWWPALPMPANPHRWI